MIEKLYHDLLAMGLKADDVVLVHTSIKALDDEILAEDIIETIMRVIGIDGTLLVPALTYMSVNVNSPKFDVNKTKPCIGILPEVFFKKYSQARSVHPTHSVCARGRYAHEITADHEKDNTPVGENSPFMKLLEYNGKILILGSNPTYNTFCHGIEERAGCSYPLAKMPIEYQIITKEKTYQKEYYPHDFAGLDQRYDKLIGLLNDKECKKGKVLNGTSYLIDAKVAMKKGLKAIAKNERFFVDKKL